MINFHRVQIEDKKTYEQILLSCAPRGCEYAFANLYFWGRQEVAFIEGCALIFSHFDGKSIYAFPIGTGDRRAAVEKITADAKQRGIPCRIGGLTPADRDALEQWFPGQFLVLPDRDGQDYVYGIDDLADLKGRKYQRKRNHVNRFQAIHTDYTVEPLTPDNLFEAQQLVSHWYEYHMANGGGDYLLERVAMDRAFQNFEALGMEGILLKIGGDAAAMTMGSFLYPNMVDVHFEKAREDIDGAYAAVNSEFARYLREKHPELQFLNREDDMGLEGLRKAKTSYNPHHMVEKYRACLMEEIDDT